MGHIEYKEYEGYAVYAGRYQTVNKQLAGWVGGWNEHPIPLFLACFALLPFTSTSILLWKQLPDRDTNSASYRLSFSLS